MEQPLPPDVHRLIKQLKSPDSGQRLSAATGLARLDCRDEKVRLASSNAAGRQVGRESSEALKRTTAGFNTTLAKLQAEESERCTKLQLLEGKELPGIAALTSREDK